MELYIYSFPFCTCFGQGDNSTNKVMGSECWQVPDLCQGTIESPWQQPTQAIFYLATFNTDFNYW